jgi:hypothetical protein
MLVATISRAFPQMLRFLISAIVLFLGFALCGSLFFGHYAPYVSCYFLFLNNSQFDEVIDSITTLFAMMNGDQIRVTFNMLFGYSLFLSILSRLYIYIFATIFCFIVLNFFVGIVGNAFDINKEKMAKLDDDSDERTDVEKIVSVEEDLKRFISEQDGRDRTMEDVMNETIMEQLQRINKTVEDTVDENDVTDTVEQMTEAFNARIDEIVHVLTSGQ